MARIVVLVTSILINATTIPAVASECASMTQIAASRAQVTAVRSQQPLDIEKACRAYAEAFYRIVVTRQAAAACGVGRQRDLAVLDSEINTFNDLLANQCGG